MIAPLACTLAYGLALAQGVAPAETAAISAERIQARILQHSPLTDAPADPTNAYADDAAAAHFGRFLFFDRRLSRGGQLSCASCHDPELAFSDGAEIAHGQSAGRRNAPSLWNLAWQRWYFWDGRADSLWSQALHPLEDPRELDGDRVAIVRMVVRDPELAAAYRQIFGALPDAKAVEKWPLHARPLKGAATDHPEHHAWHAMPFEEREVITRVFVNLGKAIAAYERRLVSKNSAFDRYVEALRAGDEAGAAAYDARAKEGLALFVGRGNCRLCHAGANFTDNEFHDIGVAGLVESTLEVDSGRNAGIQQLLDGEFRASSAFSDDPKGASASELDSLVDGAESFGQFKTPTLRNVAHTGPYMHAGQVATLRDVVKYYSTLEGTSISPHHREQILRPLALEEAEIDAIVAFLESLTDTDVPVELLTRPASPRLPAGSAAPAR